MFIPREGSTITVTLPGEVLRADVYRIVDPNTLIVALTSLPLTRNHTFRKGDLIACRRVHGALGEAWEAMGDGEYRAAQERNKARRQPPPVKAKPAPKGKPAAKPKAPSPPKKRAARPAKQAAVVPLAVLQSNKKRASAPARRRTAK